MNWFLILILFVAMARAADVEWTRFTGVVKSIDLKAQTLTIQNKEGDLFTIPIDYQVKIVDKKNLMKDLRNVQLDSKVTLIKVISEKPKEDTEGLVPFGGVNPEPTPETKRRNK